VHSVDQSPSGTPHIQLEGDQNRRTISLVGDIDLAIERHLHDALSVAMQDDPATLVLDLSKVTFMDSTGLNFLVTAHKRCRQTGCRLVIDPGGPHIHRLLEISGLHVLLNGSRHTVD
jgi:anti-anti-sigma factor